MVDWPGAPAAAPSGTPPAQNPPDRAPLRITVSKAKPVDWPGAPADGGNAPSGSGFMQKALEPITSWPGVYSGMVDEAVGKMKQGVTELGTPGQRGKGAWDVGFGALDYVTSPINATARTVVGKPLEENTGIPKEMSEFAATLAIPGIGLTKLPQVKNALRPIETILSPSTVSPVAGEAEASIRSAGGTAARDTAQTEAAMEPFHAKVNALPASDRLGFIDYVEGRTGKFSGLVMRDPELQQLADKLKTAFDQRMTKLQALPSTAQASFIQDYFPHFWQDPGKAATAAQNFGGGVSKQGSGASLKARTVPTIADGIAMGLSPITTSPIEATLRYVRSMDHFIAAQSVLDTAKAQGTVRYFRPKVMGASGNPDSFKGVPDGWKPIQGRGATDATGAQAYAPEDWARVYNNFIDRGIHKNEDWGRIYDALQSTSNTITALELGLSGFHAFTMANEAVISGVAKGIGELAGGSPIKAVGSISTAVAKPITSAMRGKKLEQVYLGNSPGSPDMRKITDLLEKAGGRGVGARHAPDYRFSAMGSYWTAFKRGALRQQMQESRANMRNRPIVGTGQEAARMIGRTMETVAEPLFQKYIPRLKNGAFYDTMKSWLDAHPSAPQEEQVKAARQIWDSIDNRFGEMVQDNIFWNKTLKQAAQLGMRSYSWNLGTVREIGGGVKDMVDTAVHGKDWSPRASYVVAMPIVVGTLNAAYQKLMTGKNPESVDDLVAGRTGGEVPGFGQRGTVPERVSLPGYQKDVIGWYLDWRREAANKLATGPRAAVVDPLSGPEGSDWRGNPVFHEGTPWLQDYFTHVLGSLGPISIKSMLQGRQQGSNIGIGQALMGIRSAPSAIQDPEGYARWKTNRAFNAKNKERIQELKQQRLYE